MKIKTNLEQELAEIKQLLTVQTDEPLSLNEAAQYLNFKKSYIYKLTCQKQIPFFRPGGKKIYFKKSELNEWIFRGRNRSKAELEAEAESYLNKKGA
jgi:excisionase family DNA binding protein